MCNIRECGTMGGLEKNGCPYILIVSDKLKSLLILSLDTHVNFDVECFYHILRFLQ